MSGFLFLFLFFFKRPTAQGSRWPTPRSRRSARPPRASTASRRSSASSSRTRSSGAKTPPRSARSKCSRALAENFLRKRRRSDFFHRARLARLSHTHPQGLSSQKGCASLGSFFRSWTRTVRTSTARTDRSPTSPSSTRPLASKRARPCTGTRTTASRSGSLCASPRESARTCTRLPSSDDTAGGNYKQAPPATRRYDHSSPVEREMTGIIAAMLRFARPGFAAASNFLTTRQLWAGGTKHFRVLFRMTV